MLKSDHAEAGYSSTDRASVVSRRLLWVLIGVAALTCSIVMLSLCVVVVRGESSFVVYPMFSSAAVLMGTIVWRTCELAKTTNAGTDDPYIVIDVRDHSGEDV